MWSMFQWKSSGTPWRSECNFSLVLCELKNATDVAHATEIKNMEKNHKRSRWKCPRSALRVDRQRPLPSKSRKMVWVMWVPQCLMPCSVRGQGCIWVSTRYRELLCGVVRIDLNVEPRLALHEHPWPARQDPRPSASVEKDRSTVSDL